MARFLDCSPPLPELKGVEGMDHFWRGGVSEQGAFEAAPLEFLKARYPPWPSHVVALHSPGHPVWSAAVYEAALSSSPLPYAECARFFHKYEGGTLLAPQREEFVVYCYGDSRRDYEGA